MFTILALIASIILQAIAFVTTLWLLRYSRSRVAWTLIAIALVFMAIRRAIDLMIVLGFDPKQPAFFLDQWLGIAVSMIMAVSVIGIARILRALKKTEKEREESEKRFQTLFHNSSDEIFLADIHGKFLEVNQVACDSLGYSQEDLKQMNFKDIKTPKFVEKVEENIALILAKGNHTYESEHQTKKGWVLNLEVKSRVINYQGERAILSIARDITERKQLERKYKGLAYQDASFREYGYGATMVLI